MGSSDSLGLEFDEPSNLEQNDLALRNLPDLHNHGQDLIPFEIDVRFEFDAPQWVDFQEEMQQGVPLLQTDSVCIPDEWFCHHHVNHESLPKQSSTMELSAIKQQAAAVNHPQQKRDSLEALVAQHNKRIRDEHRLKVKTAKRAIEHPSKSPLKSRRIRKTDVLPQKKSMQVGLKDLSLNRLKPSKLDLNRPPSAPAMPKTPLEKRPVLNKAPMEMNAFEPSSCKATPFAKNIKSDSFQKLSSGNRFRGSGKENIDDIAEMLAIHNQRFKSKSLYVPPQHSKRDVHANLEISNLKVATPTHAPTKPPPKCRRFLPIPR